MRKILIVFLLVFGVIPAYCQHPFTQDLKKLATIAFPDTPQVKKTPGRVYYSFQSKGVMYMASVSNYYNSVGDNFTHDLTDKAYASLLREVNRLNESKLFYQKKNLWMIFWHLLEKSYDFLSGRFPFCGQQQPPK